MRYRLCCFLLGIVGTLALACGPSAGAPADRTSSGAAPAVAANQGAIAEGAYKLGMSAAITGPFAASYAPAYEGFKIYLERLNARGGIDGRRIEVVYTDDRGEPPRATANAKRLVEDEQVLAVLSNSASATYAPLMTAARNGRTPLIFTGVSVCPQEVYPPQPDPWLFCSSFNALKEDAEAIVQVLGELGGSGVKLGLVAADIPVSRQGVDLIEKLAAEAGMQVVGKVAIPPGTADYSPFASRFTDAGATHIAHWGPFEIGVGTMTALVKVDWPGTYLATASPPAEDELMRFRQPNFLVLPSYSFQVEGLPVLREIDEAAKQYKATYSTSQLTLGWVGGMVVEAALRACAWPCAPDKLRSALENLRTDTHGLYGGPVDWSPHNHLRSSMFYRLYRWDSSTGGIVRQKDWLKVDVR